MHAGAQTAARRPEGRHFTTPNQSKVAVFERRDIMTCKLTIFAVVYLRIGTLRVLSPEWFLGG